MVGTTTREQDQKVKAADAFFTLAFIEKELWEKVDLNKFDTFINQSIDLSEFGNVVKYVGFAPVILKNKRPEDLNHNRFIAEHQRLVLSIELDYDQAVKLDKKGLMQYLIDGLNETLNRPNKVAGFDAEGFKNLINLKSSIYT